MADTTVNNNGVTNIGTRQLHQARPAFISQLIGAQVFIDGNSDVVATKTTDGGATWGAVVPAEAGNATCMDAFFDRRIPGDAGTLIHVAWIDNTATSLRYAAFDILAGTWSVPVDIDGSASGAAAAAVCFIAKNLAGGGWAGWANGTGSGGFKTADFATWEASGNPYESNAIDMTFGLHCSTGNTGDCRIAFGDLSAAEITVKTLTYSTDAVAESAAVQVNHLGGTGLAFDICTDLTDGSSVIVGFNEFNAATADMLASRVPAGASPTPVALTNVLTDSAASGVAGVSVDPVSGAYEAYYSRGTTLHSATKVFKKRSTDRGATWGLESAYSEAAEADVRVIRGSDLGIQGGLLQPSWFENVANDLFVNLVNDSAVAPAASGGKPGKVPPGQAKKGFLNWGTRWRPF